MREFTAVSLFCGAGGLDIGFEQAGFKTIWANDFDKDACITHQNWSKAEVVCDEGWQISMRIHSASSRVEPSLKFDVRLVSFPSSVFTQTEPWFIDSGKDRVCSYNCFPR